MTLKNLIQLAKGITPVESEIGYYILSNEKKVLEMSITELADSVHVSKSAIHRFCKRIGFSGFNELKVAVAKELAEEGADTEWIDVNYPFQKQDGPQFIARKLAKLYENAIQDTYSYLDFIQIQQVARMLNQAEGIDIYTHAHNMNVAENFQDKMLTIGKIVNCPKEFYSQRATVLASTKNRAAILLSYSGRASFLKPIAEALYQKKIPVVLIGRAGSNFYPQYVKYALIR